MKCAEALCEVPLGGALLEGVDDLFVVAQLTDEAFLSTQTAAENVGAGKLDHLGQEGSQLSIDHLQGEEREGEGGGVSSNKDIIAASAVRDKVHVGLSRREI